MIKAKAQTSNRHFRMMALMYRIRDVLRPRKTILEEAGIHQGFHVLDFGCGPGSYVLSLAGLVGRRGMVYALDVHPLAIQMVEKRAAKSGLTNVKAILSDCRGGLPDQSIDVVLLYDVFHHLEQPGVVLAELQRVLKPNGVLSVSDHHLKEAEIIEGIGGSGLFKLSRRGRRTYSFQKVG